MTGIVEPWKPKHRLLKESTNHFTPRVFRMQRINNGRRWGKGKEKTNEGNVESSSLEFPVRV